MEAHPEIDLAELVALALMKRRPDYWPDPVAAKQFAETFPATFLAIVELATRSTVERPVPLPLNEEPR